MCAIIITFAFLFKRYVNVGIIFSNLVKSVISPSCIGKFKSTPSITFLLITKLSISENFF